MNLDFDFDGATKLKDWWGQVKANFQAVQDGHNDEVSAREDADSVLQSNLDTHASKQCSSSVSGHVRLSTSTSSNYGVSQGYAATPSAVKAAYERASTAISDAAAVQTGLETETAAREAADAELQELIDAEAAAREAADTALQSNITAETTARKSADSTMESDIAALRTQAHTHGNKDVLDGITEERVETWDNNVNFEEYKQATNETIYELMNELQMIYAAIGVVSYDGGLFTQEQYGDTLDGGAFGDTDLESFDCGGFEAITVTV